MTLGIDIKIKTQKYCNKIKHYDSLVTYFGLAFK